MLRARNLVTVVLAIGCSLPVPVPGQEGIKNENSRLTKTSIGAELDRLKFYIGEWYYSEIYEKSVLFPNSGRNTGTWTAELGPQGRSIINAFVSHGTGDNYEGMEVMTWDPKARIYRDHSLWYDSAEQWSYIGQFEGETLVYRAEFEYLGKHIKFRSETRPTREEDSRLTNLQA
jgi:hypothetical protein